MTHSIVLLSFFTHFSFACSTFLLDRTDEKFFGKNYDWLQGHGMLTVNKRDVSKKAIALEETSPQAEWVSKYGSITFNQHGREFPLGGMNEEGLAVEIMWLSESEYPEHDTTPEINELQWIQYQLDNYSTTADTVKYADKIRIFSFAAPVHYLVCDRSADCATFEYVGEKLVVHAGSHLPVKVLTNDTYANSIKNLEQYIGFGGKKPIPGGEESLERFVRAASLLKKLEPSLDSAFGILKSVKHRIATQWEIVYGLEGRSLEFFQKPDFKKSRKLQLSSFDFSCQTPVMVHDLDSMVRGTIDDKFEVYTKSLNHKIIEQSAQLVKELKPLVPRMTNYPDSTLCLG